MKRWAVWPRGIRWTIGGIAAGALAVVIVWALFVPLADELAHHDVGPAKGMLHETAVDNARGRLLTLGAGLFALGALIFTARNFTLSREGQVTDRYTKAIEQLGSKELDVRIGGIYALERVARDSPRDHPTVMEVLTAFIREHSGEQSSDPGSQQWVRSTRPDVQAAVTVVGRRNQERDIRPVDLSDAKLGGAVLNGAKLGGADLSRVDLQSAKLGGADLSGAILRSATLGGAGLAGAILHGADLFGADLSPAALSPAALSGGGADLSGADLSDADLRGAILQTANLSGADLSGARISGADLFGADLSGAKLGGADLDGAKWPAEAPIPEGWEPDTTSVLTPDVGGVRLKAAGTGSTPTEAD